MLTDSIIALLISFVVCAALCPVMIPVLHRMKFGQQVRDDGPQAHLKKQGTPTMGGIMIVIAVIAGTLPFVVKHPLVRPVLIFTVVYGFIGFLDDYLKIRKKQSEGLSVKQKLVMQLIATGLLAVWLYRHPQAGSGMLIPFTGGLKDGMFLKLGILYIPAVFFIVLGTDNGVNFTDGLDGLCSSVTVAFSLFFLAAAVKEGIPAAPVAGAVIGALLGFLLFQLLCLLLCQLQLCLFLLGCDGSGLGCLCLLLVVIDDVQADDGSDGGYAGDGCEDDGDDSYFLFGVLFHDFFLLLIWYSAGCLFLFCCSLDCD